MIRFTPAVRLSLGLVVLTISLLILAQALGLTPGSEREQLAMREQLAQTTLAQLDLAITRGDEPMLRQLLDTVVARNPEVKSAGLRRLDGRVLAQTEQHLSNWRPGTESGSTPTHVRLPLIINGTKRANFEMAFAPLEAERHSLLGLPTFPLLVAFIALSGFVGFWLYIRRVLKHLDPSAVVPARVRNALNILAEGVLILDRREQIVLANNSLLEHLQRPENYLLGKKASHLGWMLDEEGKFPWLQAQESGQKQVGVRLTYKRGDSREIIYRVNAVPILDGDGKSQGTIAVFDDVSELEEKSRMLEEMLQQLAASQADIEAKNRELSFLATRDPLTNCFNRRALYQHLEGKFDGERASDSSFSCIMADVDFFKRVNDSYGHATGDAVIKMVANCLSESVRDLDMVARFGGEEFCIILPGASLAKACEIAERCREKIADKITEGVRVTGSFGVSSVSLGAKSADELIQQADEALYHSKQNGRNRVSSWQASMSLMAANSEKI